MSDAYAPDDTLDPDLDPDDPNPDLDPDDPDLPPDAGDGDPDPDDPPPRQESRAAREIRTLRDRAQAAERRAMEFEVRSQVRPEQQRDPAAEERAFLARVADLPFDQQIAAHVQRERQVMAQQLQGIELRLAQADDRSSFNALVASNPVAAKHATEVERQFKEWQAKGSFVSREILLENYLGKLALKKGPAALNRGTRAAADRITRETGRPAARRGDAAPGGRADPNSLEAIEARLKGVTLDSIR